MIAANHHSIGSTRRGVPAHRAHRGREREVEQARTVFESPRDTGDDGRRHQQWGNSLGRPLLFWRGGSDEHLHSFAAQAPIRVLGWILRAMTSTRAASVVEDVTF